MTNLMSRAQGAAFAVTLDRRLVLRGRLAIATFVASALLAAGLSQAEAGERPESFADLAEQVSPAVVGVEIARAAGPDHSNRSPFAPGSPYREFFERYFGDLPTPHPQGWQPNSDRAHGMPGRQGLGSGFIVDEKGYVVTNNHVIADAETIHVTLDDGRRLEATLIGRDPRTDLALLKVESATPLPHVAFGGSDEVRVGDWVMAVGNPFGFGGTVTVGVVSAQGREMNGRNGGALVDFIQIDAPINRGNSGGPTFNLEGEVIGINTAIFSPNGGNVGIGFAIPADQAEAVIADLRDDGKVARGWLGVRIQPVTDEIAEGFGLEAPEGALVAEVTPSSPAEAAGLASGDIILSWDGGAVERLRDLPRLVAATPAGQSVAVDLWRQVKGDPGGRDRSARRNRRRGRSAAGAPAGNAGSAPGAARRRRARPAGRRYRPRRTGGRRGPAARRPSGDGGHEASHAAGRSCR